ncbi:unnamed protein product [Brassica rapa]|uniref:Uncharacterized protein n=1 Tax=Brassica campestris TaxID=3711 RepID=A0A8D9G712_BRACM|nr:unnamed protein product [Brassica rapa]
MGFDLGSGSGPVYPTDVLSHDDVKDDDISKMHHEFERTKQMPKMNPQGNYFGCRKVRSKKAGRYLRSMRLKKSIRFSHRLPHDDPLDLRILQKLLSFELNERPTVEELRKILYMSSQREPSVQPVTKLEFEFERLKITKEAMPELIYSLIEYHPKMLKEYLDLWNRRFCFILIFFCQN